MHSRSQIQEFFVSRISDQILLPIFNYSSIILFCLLLLLLFFLLSFLLLLDPVRYHQFLMSYFYQGLFLGGWILITRESWQFYFLFLWTYIQFVVLELPIQFNFLVLGNVFSLYIVCDCQTVHGVFAKRVANVINPHNFLKLLVSF